jgi:hypothetical protein
MASDSVGSMVDIWPCFNGAFRLNNQGIYDKRGTAVAQWLRCWATNQKVASSIPDGIIGIFHWHKSFWSHYGPGFDSASKRNKYEEYFLGVNAAGAQGWQPYHHPVPLSRNQGTLTSWNLLGQSRPVRGLLYLYILPFYLCQTHRYAKSCIYKQVILLKKFTGVYLLHDVQSVGTVVSISSTVVIKL